MTVILLYSGIPHLHRKYLLPSHGLFGYCKFPPGKTFNRGHPILIIIFHNSSGVLLIRGINTNDIYPWQPYCFILVSHINSTGTTSTLILKFHISKKPIFILGYHTVSFWYSAIPQESRIYQGTMSILTTVLDSSAWPSWPEQFTLLFWYSIFPQGRFSPFATILFVLSDISRFLRNYIYPWHPYCFILIKHQSYKSGYRTKIFRTMLWYSTFQQERTPSLDTILDHIVLLYYFFILIFLKHFHMTDIHSLQTYCFIRLFYICNERLPPLYSCHIAQF